MGLPGRVVLRRRPAARLLGRIAGYLVIAAAIVVMVRALLAEEPRKLDGGARNPLAYTWLAIAAVLALGLVPLLFMLARRPLVAADHFALTVRPGSLRTLVIPWSRVAELATCSFRGDRDTYLLVRCEHVYDTVGDRPRWMDQRGLRDVIKAGMGAAERYDMAVNLKHFAGRPSAQLAWLAAYAPPRVKVANRVLGSVMV